MPLWIAVLLCALLVSVDAAFAAGRLAPKDIEAAFFNGQPFTASTPSKVKFKMVFTTDGKATREPAGKGGAKGQGTWKLSNDGFCTTWRSGQSNCYTLVDTGGNKWSVMRGPSLVAIWSK